MVDAITHGEFRMKKLIILISLCLLLLVACGDGEATSLSSGERDEPAETSARSGTSFQISGGRQIDEPKAVASVSALPGLDTVAIQIKTAVTGQYAPAIIFLENIPAESGSYSLSDLSLDNPEPGVLEAGVDIKDDEASGVYPYEQFGDAVDGMLTITTGENNRLSGTFEFSAQKDGETVTVNGAFANANLP
jgi:hypothetical protein